MKREVNTLAGRGCEARPSANGTLHLPAGAWIQCLVLLSILLFSARIEAQNPAADFHYTIENGQVTLTDYIGSATSVVVPGQIEGLPVTAVGGWTFTRSDTLLSVKLPDTVNRIGVEAFSYCRNLEEVVLGSGVTRLESYAFFGCSSLVTLELPEGLTQIGSNAFGGCLNLVHMALPPGLTRLEYGVFYGCSRLESVEMPPGLTFIGKEAFSRCYNLASIEIGSAVESVDSSAFTYCTSLTDFDVASDNPHYSSREGSLCNWEGTLLLICPAGKKGVYTLPEGIVSFLESTFQGCIHLTGFSVDENHPLFSSRDGILYNRAGNTLIVFPAGRTGQCVIPEGTTTLKAYSFSDSSLLGLILPASLTRIEDRAFWYCSSLTGIGFEGNAPETGADIFYNVPNTLAVYYKEGATGWKERFAGYPVRGNAQKQTITLTPINRVVTYGDKDFQLWASSSSALLVTLLTTPEEIATISSTKMIRIKGAGTVTITGYQPGGTRRDVNYFPAEPVSQILVIHPKAATIKANDVQVPSDCPLPAFTYTVTGLINADTPEGSPVYYINGIPADEFPMPLAEGTYELSVGGLSHPNYLFSSVPGTLTILPPNEFGFTLSDGQITITAYYGMSESVAIPENISGYPVVQIAEEAFLGHAGLKAVTFPETLRVIGRRAFAQCGLEEIRIPDGVVSIGDEAFLNCPAGMVRIGSGLNTLGTDALVGSYRINVHAENGSFSSRDGVLFNKDQTVLLFCPLGKAVFYLVPNGVLEIAPRAFFLQKSLTKIVLPSTVVKIGPWAFAGCSVLQKIVIPNTSTTLGEALFYECTSLEEVTIPSKLEEIPRYAFHNCTRLKKPVLPPGLVKVAEGAFYGCSSLLEINFPPTLTTLEKWAFRATGLTRVQIPAGVIGNLEDGVFRDCSALMDFEVDGANPSYSSPDGVLFDSTKRTLIQYPAGRAGGYTAPETLTTIHDYAFSGAAGLTELVLPAGLSLLGEELFSGCDSFLKAFFRGNAPELTGRNPFEETQATLYYLQGAKGWTNPWGGRPTQGLVGEAPSLALSGVERDEAGRIIAFTFTFSGVLESSSDMKNWEVIAGPSSGATHRVTVEPGREIFFRVSSDGEPPEIWIGEPPALVLSEVERDEAGRIIAYTLTFAGVLESSSDMTNWEVIAGPSNGATHRVVVEPGRKIFFRVSSEE